MTWQMGFVPEPPERQRCAHHRIAIYPSRPLCVFLLPSLTLLLLVLFYSLALPPSFPVVNRPNGNLYFSHLEGKERKEGCTPPRSSCRNDRPRTPVPVVLSPHPQSSLLLHNFTAPLSFSASSSKFFHTSHVSSWAGKGLSSLFLFSSRAFRLDAIVRRRPRLQAETHQREASSKAKRN